MHFFTNLPKKPVNWRKYASRLSNLRSGTKRSILLKRNNVMVPNVTSGGSFYGVIAYNKIKVDDGTAKVL